jgi:hypothetical protein
MNAALFAIGLPVFTLFCGSVILFAKEKAAWSFLQVVGAGCLIVVVSTHVAEALHLFPWMKWGSPNSAGHYLDLFSAVSGATLFSFGYLLHALAKLRNSK